MFSPIGKKKVLLQQKFGGDIIKALSLSNDEGSAGGGGYRLDSPSGKSLASPTQKPMGSPMNRRLDSPGGSLDSTHSIRDIRQKMKEQAPTSAIASTAKLEDALANVGILGDVIRKILEATSRYRPERDSVVLKAFESRTIDYTLFRNSLSSAFWLSFSNPEFEALINYFDPTHAGMVDGYSFMKAFVRLNAIRKDRETQSVRERQEMHEKNLKDEEERRKLEKEKRLQQGVDYNFTPEVRRIAMEKFETAAKKFDPGHPSAPSTAAFTVSVLKPLEFREMMKLIFNLKLDPQEAGAILKTFKPDIENEIPASDFLKYFMRVGFETREKEKAEQRKLQEALDKKANEEKLKKAEEAKNKLQYSVDYNYSDGDEQSAMKKLLTAAEKYDKSLPGSVALDGFECEELTPLDFKELVRRVFNLTFTPAELGFIIQKYDANKTSCVHCKTFITEFLASGYEERHRKHIKQVEKQRKMVEDAEKQHQQKMKSVRESEFVAFSSTFDENDLQSALKKLTHASVFYDKSRGVTLSSFEPESLTLIEFKRGLKRTFNIEFTAKEMGAIFNHLQRDEETKILCQPFLTLFVTLGAQERARIRTEQLNRQRSADMRMKEEAEKKKMELSSKILYEVDFDFEPKDREAAIAKMTEAAKKYDPKHPAAMSLQAFEVKHMGGPEWKETVRKTFHLPLTPKEVGAVFSFIRERVPEHDSVPIDRIHCGEFIKYFLQLGISERMKFHSEQLEKQRLEDAQREEANRQKLLEQANRGSYQPDANFTEEDKKSIEEKVAIAAEKFDKNHPAAPSLEAFTAAYMYPGVFRENIKSIFGIKATPKEIGYLLSVYDREKTGKISTKEFLIKFFALGKKIRDDKKRAALIKQREALKKMQLDNEEKLTQLIEKSDFEIDNDFTEEDFQEAVKRMTIASEKYDKMHPSAPNLDGFTGGPISAGAFRELMKRAFNIYLTAKEVGAIVARFHTPNSLKIIDGKQFIIFFLRLGFDARARRKAQVIMSQRQNQMNLQQEQERKLLQSLARVELDVSTTYTDTDREKAMAKLTSAAALYDKNAPGSVSMESFHCLYLTPGIFREVMKRTFSIIFSPSELAAMIAEFNNGSGNIDTSKFLVTFIKIGTEERDRAKAIQLEKEKNNEVVRVMAEKKKKQEQEQKMLLKISYHYTKEQKEEAFRKLAVAAKKYDKAHPAAMSLEGFEQKTMKPHVFREMLKRTFNFTPSAEELGAIVHHFDKKHSGEIVSQDFLIYFLKLGIAEREKEHKESLKKLREDAVLREKLHQDKMALQWAKAELNVEYEFTEEDHAKAMEKLTEASVKFDPGSAGPMGLTAFQASALSPAIFREMLRRVFRMQLTNGELAALIKEFDKEGNKHIDCSEFLVRFQLLGNERKNQIRMKQLEKQRYMNQRYQLEMEEARKKLDAKTEIELDFNFSNEDFENVMEKIRQLAVHYDKTHPSAPNLKGFQGADMKANEFKDMLMRTFHVSLNNKELAALFSYFPGIQAGPPTVASPTANNNGNMEDVANDFADGLNKVALKASFSSTSPDILKQPRICSRDFLTYFFKINREEIMKRNSKRIQKERQLKFQEKLKNDEVEDKKRQHLIQKLIFTPNDEVTCLEKLKIAGKEYAIDSAPFISRLQGFKGPALPPDKFRELFYQIFNVRFTMAEMGVLLSILDHSGLRVLDGSKFLNWFYKISRKIESYLLGESMEDVTLEMIKSDDMVNNNLTRASTAASGVSRGSGTRKSYQFSWEKNKGTRASSPGIGVRSVSPDGRKKTRNLSESAMSTTGFDESIFTRSSSFDMDNPMYQKSREGSLSPSPTNRADYRNSIHPLPSPTHSKSSPGSMTKQNGLLIHHTSFEASGNSRISKRPKGFGQISYASVESNDFDDYSISSNDVSSFARSTLSQQWFLPSLAASENGNDPISSSFTDEVSGKVMREELKELFDRQDKIPLDDDLAVLKNDRIGVCNVSGNSSRANTAELRRVNLKSAPAPPLNAKRLKAIRSTPNLIVPNSSYAQLNRDSQSASEKNAAIEMKMENSSVTGSQSIGSDNGAFLKSVFDMAEINDPAFTNALPKGADPVAKLNKISSHLHNSPMAVVAAKQKKQSVLKPTPSKVATGTDDLNMKSSLPPPTVSLKKSANKASTAGSNPTVEPSLPSGGFFFPTLLNSKVDNSPSILNGHESDQPVLGNVPNIGIVGQSEIDPHFLKELILS